MKRLFLSNKNDDEIFTPKIIQKPRRKVSPPPPINRKTQAMTGSSKSQLQYMNNIALSHCYIKKR